MASSLVEDAVRLFDDHGLRVFSTFILAENEIPENAVFEAGRRALLVGNAGPEMWKHFSTSREYKDGLPDSMDRWTRRVVDNVAMMLGAATAYPFDKPYWPFQRIAMRTTGVGQSPLGMLIHPEFGLWHGYRALLIFDLDQENLIHINGLAEDGDNRIQHPCDVCVDQPCLDACPVGAFGTEKDYDREACLGHVNSRTPPNCLDIGCSSRNACPIGKNCQYSDEQIRFHMSAFAK